MASARQLVKTFIIEQIMNNVQEVNDVLPWQNNFDDTGLQSEKNMQTPAVFYFFSGDEFSTRNDHNSICTPSQTAMMNVEIYVALQYELDFSAFEDEFLELKDKVHKALFWKSEDSKNMNHMIRVSDRPYLYEKGLICDVIEYQCSVTEDSEQFGETETVEQVKKTIEYNE